jgi:hypothetical protein
MFKFRFLAPLALWAMLSTGCALHRAPVLVGQGGLAAAQTIHQLQDAVKGLADAHILTISQAISTENALLQANDILKPLPGLLRAIDAAEKANQPDQPLIDQALSILNSVSLQMSVVINGVPLSDATKQALALAKQIQDAYAQIADGINKLKK